MGVLPKGAYCRVSVACNAFSRPEDLFRKLSIGQAKEHLLGFWEQGIHREESANASPASSARLSTASVQKLALLALLEQQAPCDMVCVSQDEFFGVG